MIMKGKTGRQAGGSGFGQLLTYGNLLALNFQCLETRQDYDNLQNNYKDLLNLFFC
jgi:hypothetical protein